MAAEATHALLSDLLRQEFAGPDEPLAAYIAEHSNLPGPAGNLTLAHQVARVFGSAASPRPQPVWDLLARWASLPLTVAPVNSPREMLPAVAALARGVVGAALPEWRPLALEALRRQAGDSRWRTRELVAQGLQALLRVDFWNTEEALAGWVADGEALEMRAAVAALAEPDLLADGRQASAALSLHRTVLDRLLSFSQEARRGESFRTLRQGLGYSLSVVVVGAPAEGFLALRALATTPDADARWVVKENLKKARLRRAFAEEVGALLALLSQSEPTAARKRRK